MRWIKFVIAAALLSLLIWLGHSPNILSETSPALGPLFNPFGGFWRNAEAFNTPADQRLTLSDDRARGEVAFDDRRIPHVFAATDPQLAFLQGYLHARDRLWQMDMSVRAAGGRLAEVLGPNLLERDRLQRRKGMVFSARRSLESWASNPDEWALLTAYADGVNSYVSSLTPASYPLEYKLMGFAPEAWTPLKSAIFYLYMAETLCYRHEDAGASRTLALLGRDTFADLFPETNPLNDPVIPPGTSWNFPAPALPPPPATEAALPVTNQPLTAPPTLPDAGNGSNNWAVAGSRTVNGHPLLCNDPHLNLTLPSIWYEIQLGSNGLNAYGASLPGVPGILIGFNARAAWGVTNVGHDVADWYRISWTDSSRTAYLLDGRPRQVTVVYDTILVKGQKEPEIVATPWTHWGPVVFTEADHPYRDLALHWIAHEPSEKKPFYEIGAFWRLMRAETYDRYRAALAGYDFPAQNFVFANQAGDIALTVNGRFPVKYAGQGRFVQDGAQSDNGWDGFIPRDRVPAVRNPARGFVSSANQRSTDDSYPYYYYGHFDDFRGRYINQRLAALPMADVADMKALQLDNFSLIARELLPLLLDHLPAGSADEKTAAQMLSELRAWNYQFDAGRKAPVVFEKWLRETYRLTFDELLLHKDSVNLLTPEPHRLISLLKASPGHYIFDQQESPEHENADAVIGLAWRNIVEELSVEYEDEDFNWSTYQSTHVPHLARIPAFGSGPLPTGGYRDAPNSVKPSNGPSWRMVVELSDPVRAWGVLPGGASGNPGSPFYDTGVMPWARGEYFTLYFMNDARDERYPVRSRWTFE